jgi:type II secretory pathway pseudopilin PulG
MAWSRRQGGISLLEMMLVVAVAALLLTIAVRQALIWNSGYQAQRQVAQMRENIAELLVAADSYYYAHCAPPGSLSLNAPLSCAELIGGGGFLDNRQCTAALQNPWSSAPLTVRVVQPDSSRAFYQVQVGGDFSLHKDNLASWVALLNADAVAGSSTLLTWTRLPNNSVVSQGVWYRVPGSYVLATNANTVGGTPFDSRLWIMRAGLAAFTRSQDDDSHGKAGCPD